MAKNDKEKESKILDYWAPPAEAGKPLGLIATSYTFDAQFFETQCLARFVGLSSDPEEEKNAYFFERDEKLSELQFCTLLIDNEAAKGVRTMRWDLIGIRVPRGVMHSKITCLFWEKYYRIIIGSANITESGLCRNKEVFSSFEGKYSEVKDGEFSVAGLSNHLKKIAKLGGLTDNSILTKKNFDLGIAHLEKKVEIPSSKYEKNVSLLFVEPESKESILEQAMSFLPYGKAEEAIVTSPFFDDDSHPDKACAITELKKYLTNSASVDLIIPAEIVDLDKKIRFLAPDGINDCFSEGFDASFYPYNAISGEDDEKLRRELHMKSYFFSRNTTACYVLGSSNFTRPGLGIVTNNNSRRNFEANIIFRFDRSTREGKSFLKHIKAMDLGVWREEYDEYECVWESELQIDEKECEVAEQLPNFFRYALLDKNEEGRFIEIYTKGKAPNGWKIFFDSSLSEPVYSSDDWQKIKPQKIKIDLKNRKVLPEVFIQLESGNFFSLPVNAATLDALESPHYTINIDEYLTLLSSKKPPYRVIDNILKKRHDKYEGMKEGIDKFRDPHARVDQSTFLLHRAGKVSRLIQFLRSKFERPILSNSSLNFMLKGPCGIEKVAEAMTRISDSSDEIAFYIAELCFELKYAKLKEHEESLKIKKVRTELDKLIHELWEKHCRSINRKNTVGEYVNRLGEKVTV